MRINRDYKKAESLGRFTTLRGRPDYFTDYAQLFSRWGALNLKMSYNRIMRLIVRKRLTHAGVQYPQTKAPLQNWYTIMKQVKANNLVELRKSYPHADQVGKATVFNIKENDFRLISSIHYNTQTLYILEVLTHAEYSTNTWKSKWHVFD